MKILTFVRTSWLMLGATLLCMVLFEGCARIALLSGLVPKGVDRSRFNESAVYAAASEPWIADYLREQDEAWVVGWRPYVYWASLPYSGDYMNIDADGLRRTWRPPGESQDPVRIFFFGGSTAWGRGARDDFTIPSLLAKKLARAPAVPAVVTNHGQSGYVSTQEVIALMLELRSGNVPDIVVFYDGVNDVFAAYQSGLAGIPQNESKRRLDFDSFESAFLLRVADRSGIVRLIRRVSGRDPLMLPSSPGPGEVDTLANEVLDAYEGNLRNVDALAAAFGFEALYFWQPVLWSKADPTEHEAEVAAGFSPLRPLYEATYARARGRESLVAMPGFLDLSGAFDGEPSSSFFDFCHVTEAANARIAGEIARAVRDRVASQVPVGRRKASRAQRLPPRQPAGRSGPPDPSPPGSAR